jgi:uncharacterized membrane protein
MKIIAILSALITLIVIVYVIILLERISKNSQRQAKLLAEIAKKQEVSNFDIKQIMEN